MQRFKLSFLAPIGLAAVVVSQLALAKAPVWEVSKGDDRLFLGGTIHVLSPDDYPLPRAFDRAYEQSDTLVFETDIAAMSDPTVQLKLMSVMTYADGTTLESVLSPDVFKKLKAFLGARQVSIDPLAHFTPAGLSLTLTVLELQRLGLGTTAGVDEYFDVRGKRDGKQIESLETIEEQISFIDGMNRADPDKVVLSSLADMENLAGMWGEMLSAWREGDVNTLEELGDESLRDEFPEMAKLLLDRRNDNWMREIPKMLEDDDVEFVLVGALHMVGDTGLIQQLKEAGFKVEQITE